MKRFLIVLCVVLSLLTLPQAAYAADALYRMLHADEVEQFKQDQDAMLVGQIIDKQRDKFKVKVLKLLSGKVSSDTIYVSADFTYGWDKTDPQVNDYGVFSLKKTGSYYKRAWGIFKATTGDYTTLQLEQLNAPSSAPGLLGDLAAIQWYVNTSGKETDFFFENSTTYVRRPNGQEVQLHPILTPGGEVIADKEAFKQTTNPPDKTASESNSTPISPIVTMVVLGIGAGLILLWRKIR